MVADGRAGGDGGAARAAVKAWGRGNLARGPCVSPVMTAVMVPEGHSADAFRKIVLENFDMSLGAGLGKVKDKVFRIGHLADTNDLTVMGALTGVEMGLSLAGIPHKKGGVLAAMEVITSHRGKSQPMALAAE